MLECLGLQFEQLPFSMSMITSVTWAAVELYCRIGFTLTLFLQKTDLEYLARVEAVLFPGVFHGPLPGVHCGPASHLSATAQDVFLGDVLFERF